MTVVVGAKELAPPFTQGGAGRKPVSWQLGHLDELAGQCRGAGPGAMDAWELAPPLMGWETAVQERLFLPLVGCGTQVSRPLPLLSKARELALVARALERRETKQPSYYPSPDPGLSWPTPTSAPIMNSWSSGPVKPKLQDLLDIG